MRAPGRHVEDLAAGRGKRRAQQAPIAGGILDPDDRPAGVVLVEPAEQTLGAGRAVRDRKCGERHRVSVEQPETPSAEALQALPEDESNKETLQG